VKSRAILLVAALIAAAAMPAQAQQPTGTMIVTVTDRMSGEALTGAQVSVLREGTRQAGGNTNEQGRFLFPGLPAGTYSVQVTYIGYSEGRAADVTVAAGQTATVNISMETTVLSLQEVVVSGVTDPTAGIKLPFTVSRVGEDQLQIPTVNSALASIQGKVAGVNIQRASGQPGAGVNILLRSPTSFEGGNSPLIVVDGVIIARDLNRTTADIEALDIVDVEVIKGAAAASLYGSRAAAGVISITTERGRNTPVGQTRVSMRTEFGKSFLGNQIPIARSHHYRMDEAGTTLVNASGAPVGWSGRSARTVNQDGGGARIMDLTYPGVTYDNLKAVYNPGQYMNTNFSVAQNTEATTFNISMTRLDEQGALANNRGFWRNTGRISVDHRVGRALSFSLTGAHTRQHRDEISSGGTVSTNPYYAVLAYPVYVDLSRKDEQGNYLQQPDSTVNLENPIWRQATRDNWSGRNRTWGSLNARYSPLGWLTFDTQLSYDQADERTQTFVPKGTPTSVTDEDAGAAGQLVMGHRSNNAVNGSFGGRAMQQFGDLLGRVTVRGTFEREYRESFSAQGRDFMVEGIRTLDAAMTLFNMGSTSTDVRAVGAFVNLGLDFRDRYVGDFLFRRDGSSLFGPLERWHNYKRASAAWLISRESWFNVPNIDELKVRYAMGEAGGRPGFAWQYETWLLSRAAGLSKSTAGNPALSPEFTREHDIGLDIIAFNNRVQLELVYATQTTKDNIIILPATVMSGYNSFRANAGAMKGNTLEATLQAFPIRTRDLTWSLTAVADKSVNTLTEWNRACFWGSNAGRGHEFTCAGERAGNFWMQRLAKEHSDLPSWLEDRANEFVVNDDGYLVWVGVNDQGQTNSWRHGIWMAGDPTACSGSASGVSGGCGWGSSFTAAGNAYYWGEPFRAWDEEFDQVQRDLLGNSLPDLSFGLNTNLRYKGLSTYLGLRGQIGGKVYNDGKHFFYNQLRHGDLDQSGKPDELKKTLDYYQRGLANFNSGWIDHFLEDGTHLKLAEARVAYRFSQNQTRRVLGNLAPTQLTLGANARNLFTLTNYSGVDPERGSPLSRVETVGYPHLRHLTMTVDIVF
jgi:TonB-linked SusC/RagA family outer membrane protein